MKEFLSVALGGSCGALSRFYLSRYVSQLARSPFPFGTLAVNLLGCFLLGFFFELFEGMVGIKPELKVMITTGFLGAFTTFSTYSVEGVNLLRMGELKLGLYTILANNVLGLVLAAAGMATAHLLFKGMH